MRLLFACLALSALAARAADSAADPALAARIARVESGLLPPARLTGAARENWTIASRLASHRVPGVSLAVIADGKIAWARAYGLARAGDPTPATTATVFPLGEVGEMVIAAALLTLVDSARLGLDAPVPTAPPAAPGQTPITLRRLLSHTAGLAASTPPRIELPPGTRWRHSPVGFSLARNLATTTAGEPFSFFVQKSVFAPAGLSSSVDDPTQGLTSTPTDLARFALALSAAVEGRASFLARATANAMITPPLAGSDFGLGVGVSGHDTALRLTHSGTVGDFRCAFVFYPRTGRGAVVMVNSDTGGALIPEILRAIAHEYDWPDYRVIEKTAIPLTVSAVQSFSGRYERENVPVLVFRLNDHFYIRIGDRPRFEIFPQSDHEFFTLDSPDIWSFERTPVGAVTHMILRSSPPQLYRRLSAPSSPVRANPRP